MIAYIFEWRSVALFLVCTAIVTGCSSGPDQSAGVGTGGTGSFVGKVTLDVTDAPAIDYAHVYVTVTGVAFHSDPAKGFSNFSTSKKHGWQVFRLTAPKTIDLAQLTNGTMYADLKGNSSLFSEMVLPIGSYHQIRLFLASTEDAYAGSVPGLVYNNEVQINNDGTHYPLRIPSSDEGIKVLPEYPVVANSGSNVSLALDFNLSDDIVKVSPNGSTEYILKSKLGYFDMGSVGSVRGAVSFSNLSTSNIEVKAEQIKNGTNYRIVRRTTSIDKNTGKFTLYPLPVFGNATTAVYDILMRGRNVQTALVKGVKIHRGSNQASSTDLGTISLQAGTEFTVQLGSSMHPTGAWLNFYQTIAGDTASYEVRYRHLDPYTGKLGKQIGLSTGAIHVASFTPGLPLAFTTDNTSQGTFSMTADAIDLYNRGAALSGINGAAGNKLIINTSEANNPKVNSNATAGIVYCVFDMTLLGTGSGIGMGMGNRNIGNPTKGQVFVTHGGMIIDSLGDLTGDTTVGSAFRAGGGIGNPVVMANIPSNVPEAVYGIYVLGWNNSYLAAGHAVNFELKKGGIVATTIKLK